MEEPFPSRVAYLPCCLDFCQQTKDGGPDCYIVCWSIGQSGLRVVSASTGETCTASEAPVCARDPNGEPEFFKAGIFCIAPTVFHTGSTEKLAVFALHQGGGVSRLLLEKEDLFNISGNNSAGEDVQLSVTAGDTESMISPAAQSIVEPQATISSSTSSYRSSYANDEGDEGYMASEDEGTTSPAVPFDVGSTGYMEGETETLLPPHQSHNEKEEIVQGDQRRRGGDAHHSLKGLSSSPMTSGVAKSPSQHVSSKSSSSPKGVKGMLSVVSKKVQAMGVALQPSRAGVEALLSSDDEGNEPQQHPQRAVL